MVRFGVLCADRSICMAPMHLEQACCVLCYRDCASEKDETCSVMQDLALWWLSNLWKSKPAIALAMNLVPAGGKGV